MVDIWGSSASNVYVVGHNAIPGAGTMYRFDGASWKTTGFHAIEGGPISGPVDLHSVHGFSANDVWIVGERLYNNLAPPPNFLDSSLIIHYNGQTWTEHITTTGRSLLAVWGHTENNIWAGGTAGTLFHYDGSNWKKLDLGRTFDIVSINGSSADDVYAIANELDSLGALSSCLLNWNGVLWAVVDSFKQFAGLQDEFGVGEVRNFSGELHSAGYGIFKYGSAGWQLLFSDPSTGFADINGESPSNLIACGLYGRVYHFNGSDWFRIDQLLEPDLTYSAVWTGGAQAFIVGFTGGGETTLIRRGS